MKKLLSILALALMLGACQNTTKNTANNDDATADAGKKTTLVAYFSASEVRATERVAKTLSEATDADLFEIVPAMAYTTEDLDWKDEQSRSTIEMKDSTARPEVRDMGFGAGMGLPNMQKNVDKLNVTSEVGVGTTVEMEVNF